MDKIELGSITAKNGFKNEDFVVETFNNWQNDNLAKKWLKAMNYNIEEIETVTAQKITGHFKADVQIVVSIKLKNLQDIQNIQVKLVSNPNGFNQIDKRWLIHYKEMWNIKDNIHEILMYFTGEKSPKIGNPRDKRRMFLNEFDKNEQESIINFFSQNTTLILNDILRGRGKFAAEWFLTILKIKNKNINWSLKNINEIINFYNGEVVITKQGNLKIGKITMQRKGGDGGRETAKMLQFKLNPCEILKISKGKI